MSVYTDFKAPFEHLKATARPFELHELHDFNFGNREEFLPPVSWLQTLEALRDAMMATIWPAPIQEDNVLRSCPQPVKIMRTQRYAAIINATDILGAWSRRGRHPDGPLASVAGENLASWKALINYYGVKTADQLSMVSFGRSAYQMSSILQQDLANNCHPDKRDMINTLLARVDFIFNTMEVNNHGIRPVPVDGKKPKFMSYGTAIGIIAKVGGWIVENLPDINVETSDTSTPLKSSEILPDPCLKMVDLFVQRPPEIKLSAQQYFIDLATKGETEAPGYLQDFMDAVATISVPADQEEDFLRAVDTVREMAALFSVESKQVLTAIAHAIEPLHQSFVPPM